MEVCPNMKFYSKLQWFHRFIMQWMVLADSGVVVDHCIVMLHNHFLSVKISSNQKLKNTKIHLRGWSLAANVLNYSWTRGFLPSFHKRWEVKVPWALFVQEMLFVFSFYTRYCFEVCIKNGENNFLVVGVKISIWVKTM